MTTDDHRWPLMTTGIYFIPFKTGASLQFSFSGQSIPNRVEVSAAKGIKIYFDAVETAARVCCKMSQSRRAQRSWP